MRARLLCLGLVIVLLTSGCLSALSRNEGGPGDVPVVPVPVHVVFVGPHPDLDRANLLSGLPEGSQATLPIQSDVTGVVERVPYRTRATWTLHEAPEAFAKGLFAQIERLGKDAPATSWLVNYDKSSGQNRLCSLCLPNAPEPAPRPVKRVDGPTLEAWIEANRASAGLAFEPHAATVFLLDHYTNKDLATDTYWQYGFDDKTGLAITQTMRAWGGTHDFVWLDRSGAPDGFDFRPWFVWGEDDKGLNGRTDPPIWDVASDPATATANVRHHLRDFYHLRAAREPLYAPHAVDRIDVKTYFIVDEGATVNKNNPAGAFLAKGGPDLFDAAHIKRAFETLAPWVTWNVELITINLPGDDPALAAALRQAKTEGGGRIDLAVLQDYFRGNFEKYAPPVENGRTYPLAFIISDAPTSTHPLRFQGGIALGNPRGAAMVAYAAFADAQACPTRLDRVVCYFEDQSASAADFYTNYITHEVGHNLAMRHPHDREGDVDWSAYRLNWLWDSTLTAMTYRHWGSDFDTFDRRYYAAHTAAMRLAHAPEDPDAPAVRELLEAGRLEEAAFLAVKTLPVVMDPHDQPIIPSEKPLEVAQGELRVVGGQGEPFVFTPPAGARWARVTLTGTSTIDAYSVILDADGKEFSWAEANHRDTHLFRLAPGKAHSVAVPAGSATLQVRVEFYASDPAQ